MAPVRLIELDPGTAVIVPPKQEPVRPLSGANTISPAGRLSTKPTPVSGSVLAGGFEMVKLRAVNPENN